MKIGFFDMIGFSYDHQLVEKTAIGGTQGLAATLALYLARSGSTVFFYSAGDHRYCLDGVTYSGLKDGVELLDVVIVVGPIKRETAEQIRKVLGGCLLVLWWHGVRFDETNGQWMSNIFDRVVVVSQYAFDGISKQLPAQKLRVIRNFLPLLPGLLMEHGAHIPQVAKKRGCLAYIGNVTRGLEHVPEVAARLRDKGMDFTIRIFSSGHLYYPNLPEDHREPELILRCRADPNVEFVRKVGKRELLQQLRDASILLMPNGFAESFCLSLIEAMYMELVCVATDRTAIPETAGGFAYLAPLSMPKLEGKFSPVDVKAYVDLLSETMENYDVLSTRLPQQKRYVIDSFGPDVAVREWQNLFATR